MERHEMLEISGLSCDLRAVPQLEVFVGTWSCGCGMSGVNGRFFPSDRAAIEGARKHLLHHLEFN